MQKHKYVKLQSICSIYNHTAGVNTAKTFQIARFKGEKDI